LKSQQQATRRDKGTINSLPVRIRWILIVFRVLIVCSEKSFIGFLAFICWTGVASNSRWRYLPQYEHETRSRLIPLLMWPLDWTLPPQKCPLSRDSLSIRAEFPLELVLGWLSVVTKREFECPWLLLNLLSSPTIRARRTPLFYHRLEIVPNRGEICKLFRNTSQNGSKIRWCLVTSFTRNVAQLNWMRNNPKNIR
jgi:hypothetical protein